MLDNDEFRNGDWTAFAERRTRTGTSRFEALTFLDLDTTPQDEGISFDELVEHLAQSCFGMSRGGHAGPRPTVIRCSQSWTATPTNSSMRPR